MSPGESKATTRSSSDLVLRTSAFQKVSVTFGIWDEQDEKDTKTGLGVERLRNSKLKSIGSSWYRPQLRAVLLLAKLPRCREASWAHNLDEIDGIQEGATLQFTEEPIIHDRAK